MIHRTNPLLCRVLILLLSPGMVFGCALSPATPTLSTPSTDAPGQTQALIEYRNMVYGLRVSLPSSWEGYSTTTTTWVGFTQDSEKGDVTVEQGPLVSIHHPDSTPDQPRQEIPIMVFSVRQWEALQAGEWWVGAAPIGPSEMERNSQYVFALPARYNYAFPEGWEEVEQILQGNSIQVIEPGKP